MPVLGILVSSPTWHVFRYHRGSPAGNPEHDTEIAFSVFRARSTMMFRTYVQMSLMLRHI